MSKKCTPLWREAHVEVKIYKTPHVCATCHLWTLKHRFAWQAQGILHLAKKWAKREGFVACPKTMPGVGHLKTICKDAFSVACAVQETWALISWEGLHFGASDLQFWEDDFAWQVQHSVWPGITFSWQAQYFRQVERKNYKTHWHEAVSSALNFPFLKEVSQNCFVFDVVKFENWRSLAQLFRFWCCQVQNWRSLAESFRFWPCQVQKLRKCRKIAAFSSLQIDR